MFYAANLLKVSAGNDIFVGSDPDWPDQVASFLETLRRPDGGYAKAMEGHAGSTYHTFLVMLVLELIERPIPQPERILSFLESQREEEGGWREIRASKRAGTNPTAAAVGCLQILDAIDEAKDPELVATTLDFLVEMQTSEGGLRANTRIPIADLLSSFTGALTLVDLEALDEIDLGAYQRFVESMQLADWWLPSGRLGHRSRCRVFFLWSRLSRIACQRGFKVTRQGRLDRTQGARCCNPGNCEYCGQK